jgi:hypothetical protein
MKTSSATPSPPTPRTPAVWLCIVINQLAFPGLGTIMAGRRVGYPQAAIMLAGFFLATGFLVWFILCVLRWAGHQEWSEADFRAQYRPYHWALHWGIGLCVVSWIWALFSSVTLLRQSKHP